MKPRCLAILGLGLLASAALAVAGCAPQPTAKDGGGTSSPSAPPTPANPKDAVLGSTKALRQTTYKYTVSTNGITGSGVADAAAKKTTVSLQSARGGTTFKVDGVVIGADMWIKIDWGSGANQALGIPTKYMHTDPSKYKDRSNIPFGAGGGDLGDAASLFKGLVDAQRVDNRHYTITLDLTHADTPAVDKETLTKLGDKAKAVPGTVTLDDQGRLSEVNVDLSAVNPAASVKVTYSDYGSAVTVNPPPASDTVEAPQSVYDMFNK